MTGFITSTTDRIGVSSRHSRLFPDQDVTESVYAWPVSFGSWQGCSLYTRVSEAAITPATRIEPFTLPKDATERFILVGVPIMFLSNQTCMAFDAQNGVFLRLAAQENSSDITNEPAAERRWMSIVQEELGTPTSAFLVGDTGADLILSDTATIDCSTFCRDRGILDDLKRCLDKAGQLFSNVVSIKAELDQFPADEYEEDGHVVIRIQVNADQDTAFREYDDYAAWMLTAIEDDKIHYLLPTMSRVDDNPE